MAELERIATLVDWPATPAFQVPAELPRRRSILVPALVAAVVAAIGIAFAVPDARSAILRFLQLGGVAVERVDTLPRAERRALAAALGVPVTRAEADAILGEPFRRAGVPLYRAGPVVSALLPGDLLLSELRANGAVLKKLAGGATSANWISVGGAPALWIAGRDHVVLAPALPPRFAGSTLVWQDGGVTFRLEGRTLTRARAIEIARRLLATG